MSARSSWNLHTSCYVSEDDDGVFSMMRSAAKCANKPSIPGQPGGLQTI